MRTSLIRSAAALVVMAALGGCSRTVDEAAAVATPAVRLSSEDVRAGRPVDVTYRFSVADTAPAFAEDYAVFVHAFDSSGTRVWTDDHRPPTPTRQWKAGQSIEYTHTMLVPGRAREGQVDLNVGLYSPGTGSRLPLGGTDAGRRSYRVGSLRVLPPAGESLAMYTEGWYRVETTGEDDGIEWHWSRPRAELWFRNPKRDAVLILQLDRPVSGMPEPQLVEIRLGATALETFHLPPGQVQLHQIRIAAEALGDADVARITLSVDKPLVPADVPEANSSDTRELGVRVFEAQLVSDDS